jgi:hypothetical protein
VVRIKIKSADFTLCSRQLQLREPAMDLDTIFGAARELLAAVPRLRKGVRLVGVAVAQLGPGQVQQALFEDPGKARRERLQQLTVELGERFGAAGVTRAALLDDPER